MGQSTRDPRERAEDGWTVWEAERPDEGIKACYGVYS
uniref:Uncharacterized protein n=1 Tax=Peronospora matthiolae TaxID=2874970 RepID=A0AAV1VM60_9STRA